MKNAVRICCFMIQCVFLLSACQKPVEEIPENIPVSGDTESADTTEIAEPEPQAIDRNITQYVMKRSSLAYWNGGLYYCGVSSPINRYNIETGNVTSACYDPLCDHQTIDCPVKRDNDPAHGFILFDGKILYRRGVIEVNRQEHKLDMSRQRCCYDLMTTAYRILNDEPMLSTSNIGLTEIYHDGNWYYKEFAYDKETGKTFGGVICINTQNGKITDFSEKTKDMNIDKMLFCVDDRLYFNDAGSIFSTDMQLNDKQVHVTSNFVGKFCTDGEAVYYAEVQYPYAGSQFNVYRLWRYDMTDWSCTDLGILTDTSLWFLTDQYIYYAPFEAFDEDSDDFQLDFKSIWRCKHDGTEKEKVFDLLYFHEGEEKPYSTITILDFGDPVVVGDSMYAMFNKWEDLDGDGKYDAEATIGTYMDNDQVRLLHVNLTDGSYEIIEVE